jgi:hypothetical protein
MSLHASVGAPAVDPAPGQTLAAPRPADPVRDEATAVRFDEKAAKLEAKAETLEGQAAECNESKAFGRLDAKNKRHMAATYREQAAKMRRRAEALRSVHRTAWPPAPAPAPEVVRDSAPTGGAPSDLAEQLTRLASLREAGVLNEEEFTSAKARLLE